MKKAKDNICPRCGGCVPNEFHKGKYPGALSRVADYEICSQCGVDEAMRSVRGLPPINTHEWVAFKK